MRAVILAGGLGTRLRPYTVSLPKPLMPINGEFPILEIILKQLKRNGFRDITIAVGYLSEIIEAFFSNGSKWGLNINYSKEESALSTIGPLTLINNLPENFLVMNGDILTDLSYRELMQHHLQRGSDVTVAVSKRKTTIDYGVIGFESERIISFIEKPQYQFDVSMGIYIINKSVIDKLQKSKPYGFDNLMLDGIRDGLSMRVFQYDGYWLDIGRPDDYETANLEFSKMRDRLVGRD